MQIFIPVFATIGNQRQLDCLQRTSSAESMLRPSWYNGLRQYSIYYVFVSTWQFLDDNLLLASQKNA